MAKEKLKESSVRSFFLNMSKEHKKELGIIITVIIFILILSIALLILNSLNIIKITQTTDSYDWVDDNIVLMKHESEDFYNCFGCSEPGDGPALCIDPTFEMKLVDETESRYCDGEFNVVEG